MRKKKWISIKMLENCTSNYLSISFIFLVLFFCVTVENIKLLLFVLLYVVRDFFSLSRHNHCFSRPSTCYILLVSNFDVVVIFPSWFHYICSASIVHMKFSFFFLVLKNLLFFTRQHSRNAFYHIWCIT